MEMPVQPASRRLAGESPPVRREIPVMHRQIQWVRVAASSQIASHIGDRENAFLMSLQMLVSSFHGVSSLGVE
jgi:hypothetical protein